MAIPYPNINPIALTLRIRWYSLAYLAGFLLGWRYIRHIVAISVADQLNIDPDNQEPESNNLGTASSPDVSPSSNADLNLLNNTNTTETPILKEYGRLTKSLVDDFLTWAVIGVILGGRLGYVFFYQRDLYIAHPFEAFKLWDGGMSFHGGAAGTIIAMIIFAWRRQVHVLRLTDAVCAAVPIGLFFGRIANFINGELYGRLTDVRWGMVFPNDPAQLPRHPSQLYEAGLEGLALFIILAILIHMRKIRERPGIVSAVFLLGYAAARMAVENFRQPDAQLGFIVGHATMGQLLCIPMVVGALVLLWWACLRKSGDVISTAARQ